MFKVTFTLTKSELYQGLLAISRSHFSMRAVRYIGLLWVLLVAWLIYRGLIPKLTLPWYIFFFILFLGFVLSITFIVEINCRILTNRLLKANAQITEQTTYWFDEESYQLTGGTFSTRMAYHKLYEVREVSDFILLRISEVSAHLIPKRAFSEEQLNRLKSILNAVPTLKTIFKANPLHAL